MFPAYWVYAVFFGIGGGLTLASVIFFIVGFSVAPLVLIIGLIIGWLGIAELIHPEKDDYHAPNADQVLEDA